MIAVQGLTWTSTWVAAPESRDGVVVRVLVASVALLPLVPMVRVFVGPVPLYLTDALLVALAAVILRPNRLERRERRLLGVGAACLAATVPSLVIALVAGDEPAFTLYYYGRRVLALASFATFLALFAGPPARRRLAVGALMAGTLVAGVWCVGQVLTRSTGAVGAVDHVYYDRLFQAGREVAVDRWAAAWKTPRAIAGWWNANVAGAALALGLAIVAGAGAGRLTVATLGVAWVGLFATASRQALLGAALVTGVLAFERGTRRGRLLATVGVGLVLTVLLAGDQLARVSGFVEGGLDEGFASRWNNYPDFADALAASTPFTFVFGRGAESWTAVSRAGVALDSSGFVSNALLLTLAENGLVGLVGFVTLLVTVARHTTRRWQRGAVVLVVWLLNCDNHLYLSPGLIAIMAIVLALAAAPAGPRLVSA
jgi:hypothetical protein